MTDDPRPEPLPDRAAVPYEGVSLWTLAEHIRHIEEHLGIVHEEPPPEPGDEPGWIRPQAGWTSWRRGDTP